MNFFEYQNFNHSQSWTTYLQDQLDQFSQRDQQGQISFFCYGFFYGITILPWMSTLSLSYYHKNALHYLLELPGIVLGSIFTIILTCLISTITSHKLFETRDQALKAKRLEDENIQQIKNTITQLKSNVRDIDEATYAQPLLRLKVENKMVALESFDDKTLLALVLQHLPNQDANTIAKKYPSLKEEILNDTFNYDKNQKDFTKANYVWDLSQDADQNESLFYNVNQFFNHPDKPPYRVYRQHDKGKLGQQVAFLREEEKDNIIQERATYLQTKVEEFANKFDHHEAKRCYN